MNTFSRLLRHYPLTLLCVALIWYLSFFFRPPETPLNDVPLIDKWTHLVMYGGTCGVLWCEYLRRHQHLCAWQLLLYAIVGPTLMGALIELLQAYCTTNRSGEWLDLLADTLGVLLAAAFGLTLHRIKKHPVE